MTDDLEGKIIAGKYRIDALLSEGEMGPVYRGSNILMDKPVTVKVLVPALAVDKRFVDRFLADAKSVSKAGHPNILNVLDFGTDTRDITYAIYEEAPGEALSTAIGDGSLSVDEAIDIARQAARGLAAAHEQGLIHGGLTPDAVFVLKAEAVKVFEFGSQPVGKGSNAGIEYRAPETYDGEKADERSDIYSLGVILYEMLTGVVPFVGESAKELKEKQDSGPPPPLSAFRTDIPADLEPMILSAIAIDPERRYQTMKAFAEDLEMLAGGVPKTATAAASAVPKRNIWQTAFMVLIGVVALAGVLIYATSVKRTDPTTAEMQSDPASLPVQPIGPATGAQEESLAKLAPMTREEIMAFENSNTTAPLGSTLPGGDGYNAWGNGGVPPAGAPLTAPGGQTMTVQPGGSQFMPGDVVPPGCTMLPSGVILCPKVLDPTVPQPSPAPKNSKGNTNAAPATTPKPFAVPPGGSNTNTSPTTRTTRPARTPKPNGGGPQEEN